MDCSVGLRQVHQLFSGLFVSSASEGKIACSLDFLLCPKLVPSEQILGLSDANKELLMCRFKDLKTGDLEWCSYRHRELMQGESDVYALSALSAFPLPIWPFFGNSNPGLNPFEHFMQYLPAYHPSLMLKRLSRDSIQVIDGDNLFFASFAQDYCFILSVFASKESALQVSLYRKGFGACVVDIGRTNSPISRSKLLGQLDPLQYEGNVHFLHFDKSMSNHECSALCFLENGKNAARAAESLFNFIVDSVPVCDPFLLDLEQFSSSIQALVVT